MNVDSEYPMGAVLAFADSTATVSDDVGGVAEGIINGQPIYDDDGNLMAVPAWTERDNGREATTVFVVPSNILGVRTRR